MSREVTQVPIGLVVDHEDHDTLNNRRDNLRVCTYSQNAMNRRLMVTNTTGTPGIYWRQAANKWMVKITVDYKTVYLGQFGTLDEAKRARRDAEARMFGQFAYGAERTEQ
jgi:hypothetical protein